MTAYPAQVITGEVVRIESKYAEGSETILVATDGREFVAAKVGINLVPRERVEEVARAAFPDAAAQIAKPAEPSEEAELKTEAELRAEAEEADAELTGTGDPMDAGGPLALEDDEATDETPAADAEAEADSDNGEEAEEEADAA